MGSRVVLAMSGGVDSSVAAHLLKEQGYEVIGLFMRTGAHAEDDERRAKTCCSATDAVDARHVADRLDIPFYALDFERDFAPDHGPVRRRVRRRPDAQPVRHVQHLAQVRQALVVRQAGRGRLRGDRPLRPDRGRRRRVAPGRPGGRPRQGPVVRPVRPPARAAAARPLPGRRLPKAEIRAIARELGLPVHDKPDSQEICFVPDDDYLGFVRGRRPGLRHRRARSSTRTGTVLGRHAGIEAFTIGQRRGLGIAVGEPRYVVQIEPASRTVTVGRRESLDEGGPGSLAVQLARARPRPARTACLAQIRAQHRAVAATVEPLPGERRAGSSSTCPSRPSPRARSSPSTRTTWSSAAAGSTGRSTCLRRLTAPLSLHSHPRDRRRSPSSW